MIDVTRTVALNSGVVSNFGITVPDADHPLWSVGARLRDVPGVEPSSVPLSARVVGAQGHSRSDALVRGAGEAVERFALHPNPLPGTHHGRYDDLAEAALDVFDPAVALADPAARDRELTWFPGTSMADGRPVLVPAPLVDWPAAHATGFDPGPSCAASGAGLDMAVRSALVEMVERDAVTCAWERGLALPATRDPFATGAAVEPRDRDAVRALRDLWARARDNDLSLRVGRLPTAVPGLFAAVAGLTGDTGTATVGLKVSDRPWQALLGATQEAWQVRAAVVSQAADPDLPAYDGGVLATEEERLAWLATPPAAEVVGDWVDGFVDDELDLTTQRVTTAQLLDSVLADGGRPVLVDLTPRLPAPLREMGWCAVKVIPVGYQHLRMDERFAWSWNRARIDSAPDRTGLRARHRGCDPARPHPLP